jgi:DHA1 family bicyclomycin/chloramphenicol resistance-like MFS transporter
LFDALKGGPRPEGWRGDVSFVFMLGALMAITPSAVDMYLPALPTIGRALDASQDQIQWSLSGFFLAFAFGQLAWGPIGDRFGRRGPTVAGVFLFAAGSAGCVFAQSALDLAVWRVVQALGASAAPVLARAMVRDVFDRDRSASVMSLMMLVMGAAPMLAPMLGSQILKFLDWRAIFVVLGALGLIALLPLTRQPETLPPERRRSGDIGSVLGAYSRLLRDKRYIGYVLGGAGIFGAMFAYISGTPFVYIELFGVEPETYGLLFGLNIVGMMASNFLNSRLVMRLGSDAVLRIGLGASVVFGFVLLAVGATGAFGLAGIVAGLLMFLACMGLIGSNAMAGALADHPQIAGAASALAGFMQFVLGAVSGFLVAVFADGTPVPMCATILAMATMGFCVHALLVRKRPEA